MLSQGLLMRNIKALVHTIQKLWLRLKFSISRSNQGQGRRIEKIGTQGKVFSQGIIMWNIKALAYTIQKLWPRLKFSISRSNQCHKVKKICYPWKSLVTRNYHLKYQSPCTYHSKVIAKGKVFGGWQKDKNSMPPKQKIINHSRGHKNI